MGLIIPQTVKVKTAPSNCKYFREKGYEFKKFGEIIEVDVLDLPKGSDAQVKCTCDICGKQTKIGYRQTINNKKITCRNKNCTKTKKENTSMGKYKVKCVLQSKEIRDKGMQTLKEKYGEDITNAFQATEVKKQIRQTNINNYGVENPM